jgi:hypothetical protein
MLEARPELECCDGEIIIPDKTFHQIQSIVMSINERLPEGTVFVVFDHFREPNMSYIKRYNHYLFNKGFPALMPVMVDTEAELKAALANNKDFEGSIIRNPNAPYKFGRSTLAELGMIKYIQWITDEATIMDVKQLVENADPDTYQQQNLRVLNLCGSFEVFHPVFGRFFVGSGLNFLQQKYFWKNKPIGKTLMFKYKAYGTKDKPRTPIFLQVKGSTI